MKVRNPSYAERKFRWNVEKALHMMAHPASFDKIRDEIIKKDLDALKWDMHEKLVEKAQGKNIDDVFDEMRTRIQEIEKLEKDVKTGKLRGARLTDAAYWQLKWPKELLERYDETLDDLEEIAGRIKHMKSDKYLDEVKEAVKERMRRDEKFIEQYGM